MDKSVRKRGDNIFPRKLKGDKIASREQGRLEG